MMCVVCILTKEMTDGHIRLSVPSAQSFDAVVSSFCGLKSLLLKLLFHKTFAKMNLTYAFVLQKQHNVDVVSAAAFGSLPLFSKMLQET